MAKKINLSSLVLPNPELTMGVDRFIEARSKHLDPVLVVDTGSTLLESEAFRVYSKYRMNPVEPARRSMESIAVEIKVYRTMPEVLSIFDPFQHHKSFRLNE